MDPVEYEQLIAKLDGDIEEARRTAEGLRRREDIERRARALKLQIDGLLQRRTTLAHLGLQNQAAELDPLLTKLQGEFGELREDLAALGPPTPNEEALLHALGAPRSDLPSPHHPMDTSARSEAMSLIDEIEAGKLMLESWPHEARISQVRVWALRWRTLGERIGQSVTRTDPVMRKAYAVIMETRERYPGLPFIEALDPRRHGEWERELVEALKDLAIKRELVPPQGLGAGNGRSNRDLLVRILSRMLARKEIGGRPTTFEQVYQLDGELEHTRSREAAELLIKHGILLAKPGVKDLLVSIDADWSHQVKRFCEGAELGHLAVDRWCRGEGKPA